MAGLSRSRDARRSKSEPYASIPCALLGSREVQYLSDDARAVFWLLNASWAPDHTRKGPGFAVLPIRDAAKLARCSRAAAGAAFKELEAAGLIVLGKPAIRPGRAGSEGKGKSAEWRVIHRETGASLPSLPPGTRRVEGSVRLHVERIRADVPKLAGKPLWLLTLLLSIASRDKYGGLFNNDPKSLPLAQVAEVQWWSITTTRRVLATLVDVGALVQASAAKGRAPATYCFGPAYSRREKHLKIGKPCPVTAPYEERRALARHLTPLGTATGHVQAESGARRVPPQVPHEGTMQEAIGLTESGATVPVSADPLPASPSPALNVAPSLWRGPSLSWEPSLEDEAAHLCPMPPAAAGLRHRGRADAAADTRAPERIAR